MLPSRAVAVTFSLAATAVLSLAQTPAAVPQPPIGSRTTPVLTVDGLRFRDLNRSGSVDPYEDWRLPVEQRVADLVARMTLEEKAGTMMHGTAPAPMGGPGSGLGTGAAYDLAAAQAIVLSSNVTSLITRLSGSPKRLAEQTSSTSTGRPSSRTCATRRRRSSATSARPMGRCWTSPRDAPGPRGACPSRCPGAWRRSPRSRPDARTTCRTRCIRSAGRGKEAA